FQHSRVHRQITLPNGGTRSVLQDGAALRAYHGNVPLLRWHDINSYRVGCTTREGPYIAVTVPAQNFVFCQSLAAF
uniref:HEAT repeat-containing protein 1 n=1 Tax=Parascaris univalens TaxID=6257 RepID=A0A915A035_PARUN